MENISIIYRWIFSALVSDKHGQGYKNFIGYAIGSDFVTAQSDSVVHLKSRKLKLLHINTIQPIKVDLAWYSDTGIAVPQQYYKHFPPPDIPEDPNAPTARKAAVLH